MKLRLFGKEGCCRCDNIKPRLKQADIEFEYYDLEKVIEPGNLHPMRVEVRATYAFYDDMQVPFAINGVKSYDYLELNILCKERLKAKKAVTVMDNVEAGDKFFTIREVPAELAIA